MKNKCKGVTPVTPDIFPRLFFSDICFEEFFSLDILGGTHHTATNNKVIASVFVNIGIPTKHIDNTC